MKVIIILQAILNLVRKRRDLIANRSKIPANIKNAIKAIYDPAKQGMTNYDVIEAYVEDFTKFIKNDNGTFTQNKYNSSITTQEWLLYKTNGKEIEAMDIYITADDNVSPALRYYYYTSENNDRKIFNLKVGLNHLPASCYKEKGSTIGIVFEAQPASEFNITITQLPTSILKDLSGNGNHAYLYGGKGKLNSGMGLYKVDFTSWKFYPSFNTVEYYHNKLVIKKAPDTKNVCAHTFTDKFTAKISNIPDGTNLYYKYYDRINKKNVSILLHNGINEIDYTNADGSIKATSMFIISKDVDFNITIEQIPDYPDQLCYDGKMYAVCYGFPILTDYTVMADRTWFERQNRACFLSKIITSGTGAFGFEFYNEYNKDTTYSFGRVNDVEQFKDGITWQITNSYNGIVKLDYIVNNKDNAELYIGKLRPTEHNGYVGCHGKIIIADRSFTEDEITWLKDNWKKI